MHDIELRKKKLDQIAFILAQKFHYTISIVTALPTNEAAHVFYKKRSIFINNKLEYLSDDFFCCLFHECGHVLASKSYGNEYFLFSTIKREKLAYIYGYKFITKYKLGFNKEKYKKFFRRIKEMIDLTDTMVTNLVESSSYLIEVNFLNKSNLASVTIGRIHLDEIQGDETYTIDEIKKLNSCAIKVLQDFGTDTIQKINNKYKNTNLKDIEKNAEEMSTLTNEIRAEFYDILFQNTDKLKDRIIELYSGGQPTNEE